MNSSGRTHSFLSPLLRWVLQLPPTKVPSNTHLHGAAMKSVTHNLSLLFLLLSAELPVFCSLRISCTSASFLLRIFSNVSYSLFCKTELFSFFFFFIFLFLFHLFSCPFLSMLLLFRKLFNSLFQQRNSYFTLFS